MRPLGSGIGDGIAIAVDGKQIALLNLVSCQKIGCLAERTLSASQLAHLLKAQHLGVSFRTGNGEAAAFQFDLTNVSQAQELLNKIIPSVSMASTDHRFDIVRNRSLTGRALVSGRHGWTLDQCIEYCLSMNADCNAFTYDQPARACRLLANVGKQIEFNGSISGWKIADPLIRLSALLPNGGSVKINGSNKVRIGSKTTVVISSSLDGEMIVFDVDAKGRETLLYSSMAILRSLPNAPQRYGDVSFDVSATYPIGKGRLVAMVVPRAKVMGTFSTNPSLSQIVAQLHDAVNRHCVDCSPNITGWDYSMFEYEVTD